MNTFGAVDLSEFRLGPEAGFYPVQPLDKPPLPQLWVPEVLQAYEARCLAEIVEDGGVDYSRVFAVSRGGFLAGGIVAYANGQKLLHGIQTIGYDPVTNEPLDEPILACTPDLVNIPKHEKAVLVIDDLVDKGEAMRVVLGWIKEFLMPDRIDIAVIYDKDLPHTTNPTYSVRTVPNKWLDHENQAKKWRRHFRLKELIEHLPQMQKSLGFLATQAVDLGFLRELIAASEESAA